MKVSRALLSHWQKQYTQELKLQKEVMRECARVKHVARYETEMMVYERHVKKLQLNKLDKQGKNIDVYS